MDNVTFTILISEACKDSWPDIVWAEARAVGAKIYLDYCKPIPIWLRKARKVHFSNPANRRYWLPMKRLWDWSNILRPEQLDPSKRNYIIFQTGIKYSPSYIRKLKEKHNACIVLYMPDTFANIGIAHNKKEFDRFCKYYQVDQVYSFDKCDCEKYGLQFFDLYSMIGGGQQNGRERKPRLLYVGNCRSPKRLELIHAVYEKLHEECDCHFFLNWVPDKDKCYTDITYNHFLSYRQVVELVRQNDAILEIMNEGQVGNTLRFKEAVCYNKLLLTNNRAVKESPYYNSEYMQVFERVDDIELFGHDVHVDYHYHGTFCPQRLLAKIVETDN